MTTHRLQRQMLFVIEEKVVAGRQVLHRSVRRVCLAGSERYALHYNTIRRSKYVTGQMRWSSTAVWILRDS